LRETLTDDMRFLRNDGLELSYEGGDEFVRSAATNLATATTIHQGHMPEIELIDDTSANGIWAMNDWIDDPDGGRAWKGFGHYHVQYEKNSDGAWRIKEMRVTRLRFDQLRPGESAVIE
jgi:hypothetical protein